MQEFGIGEADFPSALSSPPFFSLLLLSLFPSLLSLPSEVGPLNLVRVSVEGCTVNALKPSPKGGGGRLVRL